MYVVAANGLSEALLLADGSEAAWSPDGERIAYVIRTWSKEHGERSQVWVANGDGTDSKRLTRGKRASFPSWSPDGRRIAFVGESGVAVVSADGADERTLFFEPYSDSAADWSPDGNEILTASFEGITAVRTDGSGARSITRDAGDAQPVWSPDGRRIAFARRRLAPDSWTRSIYVINRDGTGFRRITRGGEDSSPAWSLDGSRIVFRRAPERVFSRSKDVADGIERWYRLQELYVVDANGTGLRRLTTNDVSDDFPDWRPPPGTRPAPPLTDEPNDLVAMPDVSGERLPKATRLLEQAGLKVRQPREAAKDPYGDFVVALQAPEAGARVGRGTYAQLAVLDFSDPFAGRPFDRKVWLEHEECDFDSPRARMYEDLARSHLRRGMTRKEVERLLGPGENDEWPLGYASGFRADCDLLHVQFDRRGRLTRVGHFQT